MDIANLRDAVHTIDKSQFNALAMQVFHYQSVHCAIYQQYLEHLQISPTNIQNLEDIPYLPIEFFKQFEIKTDSYTPVLHFESSSTTDSGISKHFLASTNHYEATFIASFNLHFGDFTEYCHLALLPSYLERKHSSLVYQVNHFIKHSKYKQSSFYIHNHAELYKVLIENEKQKVPSILWGVSFALLDFISEFRLPLHYTKVIETGGMKGRRKEITRDELHEDLNKAFQTNSIAGEYGMTELMSQAYAVDKGIYKCPPWMRVSAREINDPLSKPIMNKHGAINIIDLCNIDSCAFIASSDLGKVYDDGSFEILGRIDYSDTRGCNLLV